MTHKTVRIRALNVSSTCIHSSLGGSKPPLPTPAPIRSYLENYAHKYATAFKSLSLSPLAAVRASFSPAHNEPLARPPTHLDVCHQLLCGGALWAALEVDENERHGLVVLRLLQHNLLPVQQLRQRPLRQHGSTPPEPLQHTTIVWPSTTWALQTWCTTNRSFSGSMMPLLGYRAQQLCDGVQDTAPPNTAASCSQNECCRSERLTVFACSSRATSTTSTPMSLSFRADRDCTQAAGTESGHSCGHQHNHNDWSTGIGRWVR